MRRRKSTWTLIIWTVLMLIFALLGPLCLNCEFFGSTCPPVFVEILWIFTLVIWFLGAVPITIVWYLFRPKRPN